MERIIMFNDSFQNWRSKEIPKAQLILTDLPYQLGNNMYGSNPSWYIGGDNKIEAGICESVLRKNPALQARGYVYTSRKGRKEKKATRIVGGGSKFIIKWVQSKICTLFLIGGLI